MDHRAALVSLLRFDRPLVELEAGVAGLEGSAPLVTLTRRDIALIVRRHLSGLLTAQEVQCWAALVEGRDDIDFEPRHEPAVADAIFDLGNPDLQGKLVDIAPDVLALLGD